MSGSATFGARARIRLSALQHNLSIIRDKADGARIMPVVKANAYGHGLVEIARCLPDVDCLAVARFEEALRLRSAGIDTDIAVLGGPLSSADLGLARDLNLHIAVHDAQQVRWLDTGAARLPRIWLKVDTGMRRLGIYPDAVPASLDVIRNHSDHVGLMTHFANADDPREPTPDAQLETFFPLLEDFDGDVSIANSPGLLGWAALMDRLSAIRDAGRLWVRPGLALYGLSPFPDSSGEQMGLKPVMQFESRLLSVKPVNAGDRVGYGGTWRAPGDTVLGVIAVGYGDGYSRFIPSGAPVLVNGRRVPIAGRISMDLTAVDLGIDATDQVGDPVVLWGDGLPVEEIARAAGTIPYELVTGVTHREPAVYED